MLLNSLETLNQINFSSREEPRNLNWFINDQGIHQAFFASSETKNMKITNSAHWSARDTVPLSTKGQEKPNLKYQFGTICHN